jgi:RadC-like JAB domain
MKKPARFAAVANPPSVSIGTTEPYRAPRYRVTLVCETQGTGTAVPIRDSMTAVQLFRPCFEGLDREHFLVCGLDAKHRVIGINVVSVGTLTLSIVHPREVFKPLIVMNAAAWLCAHNLCGAPHKLCYVTSRVMWSSPGTREKTVDLRESWTFAALPHCT